MAGGMGGAAPAAGGMGAAAEALPKITKRGKGSKEEEQQGPPSKMIKFTKLEQQMYKILKGMEVPYNLFAQYSVKVPGEQRPFTIDFAYPNIGVGVETDGAIWHQREDFIQRDKIRDQKLANVGWRIMRFREDSIEENPDAVKDTIFRNMAEAVKSKKKASESTDMVKYASVYDYMLENRDEIFANEVDLPDGLGKMLLIGTF
jgi:very-short-patch-repair endonuclease